MWIKFTTLGCKDKHILHCTSTNSGNLHSNLFTYLYKWNVKVGIEFKMECHFISFRCFFSVQAQCCRLFSILFFSLSFSFTLYLAIEQNWIWQLIYSISMKIENLKPKCVRMLFVSTCEINKTSHMATDTEQCFLSMKCFHFKI